MTRSKKTTQLVYSTEHGKTCPKCENPIDSCTCGEDTTPEGDGTVRVLLETKGRNGKGVTVLTGIKLKPNDLKALSKELKKKCGVGGAIKDTNVEIQGDHRDFLIELMKKKGYNVKRSGG